MSGLIKVKGSYWNAEDTILVETLTDLAQVVKLSGIVWAKGTSTAQDGGFGAFVFDSTVSHSLDDGVDIIAPTNLPVDVTVGCWVRIDNSDADHTTVVFEDKTPVLGGTLTYDLEDTVGFETVLDITKNASPFAYIQKSGGSTITYGYSDGTDAGGVSISSGGGNGASTRLVGGNHEFTVNSNSSSYKFKMDSVQYLGELPTVDESVQLVNMDGSAGWAKSFNQLSQDTSPTLGGALDLAGYPLQLDSDQALAITQYTDAYGIDRSTLLAVNFTDVGGKSNHTLDLSCNSDDSIANRNAAISMSGGVYTSAGDLTNPASVSISATQDSPLGYGEVHIQNVQQINGPEPADDEAYVEVRQGTNPNGNTPEWRKYLQPKASFSSYSTETLTLGVGASNAVPLNALTSDFPTTDLEVDIVTGGVRNRTGRTLTMMGGLVSMHLKGNNSGDKEIYFYSEISTDNGFTWTDNPNSGRQMFITDTEHQFASKSSEAFNWPHNAIVRFMFYSNVTSVIMEAVTTPTARGSVIGPSFRWRMTEL